MALEESRESSQNTNNVKKEKKIVQNKDENLLAKANQHFLIDCDCD